jgi:hypothetical protein
MTGRALTGSATARHRVHRLRALALAAALMIAILPQPARAWNDHGHMIAAAVAYRKLRPSIRAKVDRLVALNPDYPSWIAHVAPARRGLVAFLLASTWADAIKRDGRHVNDGNRPDSSSASRNEGYGDDLQHRYWHFIDLPFSPDGTPGEPTPVPNAQTQIAAIRAVLASADAPDALKSYDLVWLLHLVADVHQPLHCISRFDRAHPTGDQGGNLVPLCAPPCKDQLHGYWDSILGSDPAPETAIAEAARLPDADPHAARVADEALWVRESFDVAKARAYVDPPIGHGPGPFTIDSAYAHEARRVARAQVALAGVRLANLLDAALR